MGLRYHSDRTEQGKVLFLSLPLVLVVLAAAFAAIAGSGELAGFPRLQAGHPIRIDLAEVEQITAHRDLAAYSALTAGQQLDLVQTGDPQVPAPALSPVVTQADAISAMALAAPLVALDGSPLAMDGAKGLGGRGVLPIDFDLAGGPQSASALQVRKDVQHDGRLVGRVEIRIDNNSAIYVARTDLLQAIPSAQDRTRTLQGEFVELIDLREAGINLRYDPVSDRLILRE